MYLIVLPSLQCALRPNFRFCRPGLSARQPLFPSQPPSDQVAVNIEEGNAYDLDEDIEGLRESVGRLKQVSYAIQEETALTQRVLESLVSLKGNFDFTWGPIWHLPLDL